MPLQRASFALSCRLSTPRAVRRRAIQQAPVENDYFRETEHDTRKCTRVHPSRCLPCSPLPPPSFAQTDLAALYEAAKAEGQLTTIALPHDWCGYGAVIEGFKAKYPGITVNELNPNAGSADEIEAIKRQYRQYRPAGARRDRRWPQPSVRSAKAEGLMQPYKVSTWDDDSRLMPRTKKAIWYGDYYGVMAFLA
jgi:hypothetical protein